MKKQIIKTLAILAFITLACVLIARTLSSSETVADYAADHVMVGPTVDVIRENEEQTVEETEDEEIDDNVVVTDEAAAEEETDVQNDMDTEDGVDAESEEDEETESSDEESVQIHYPEGLVVSETNSGFYIEKISDELKEYMRGKSYADGIDESIVNFDMLRHLVILYNDFDGNVQQGELVCNELISKDLLEIFEELFNAGYQFERIELIDKYNADDDLSMEADNTSCFNYRLVDRSTKLSYHAYGLAIDINPFINPYVEYKADGNDYICPEGSEFYAYRDNEFEHKINHDDLCYKLFKQHGFKWGGDWNSCKDYQHFEKRLIER